VANNDGTTTGKNVPTFEINEEGQMTSYAPNIYDMEIYGYSNKLLGDLIVSNGGFNGTYREGNVLRGRILMEMGAGLGFNGDSSKFDPTINNTAKNNFIAYLSNEALPNIADKRLIGNCINIIGNTNVHGSFKLNGIVSMEVNSDGDLKIILGNNKKVYINDVPILVGTS
jgi:cytoskeletal protein CcmA (bactofilin family)